MVSDVAGAASKTLWLLRHAKADRESGVADHERALAERGREDATRVGRHLAETGVHPDLVLCSSSRRTRETLECVAAQARTEWVVLDERELYLASEGELLRRLQSVPDSARTVLLVGHNPGVGDLALRLATAGPAAARARIQRKFATGALAELRLHAEHWRNLPRGCELTAFVTPKDLRG